MPPPTAGSSHLESYWGGGRSINLTHDKLGEGQRFRNQDTRDKSGLKAKQEDQGVTHQGRLPWKGKCLADCDGHTKANFCGERKPSEPTPIPSTELAEFILPYENTDPPILMVALTTGETFSRTAIASSLFSKTLPQSRANATVSSLLLPQDFILFPDFKSC
jgi:hypothetical protein